MTKKSSEILIHVLCWLVFLTLPVLMGPSLPGSWEELFNPSATKDFVTFLLMIGFFYLNYLVIIPKFYFRKKYFYFILISLVCFAVTVLLPAYFLHCSLEGSKPSMHGPPDGPPHHFPHHKHHIFSFFEMSHNMFLFFAIFFVSLTIKLRDIWKQSEKEKLSSELLYLKSQINPHFLFNTLNSIYSLSITEKAPLTSIAIVKLSGMMRYVTTEVSADFVSLEKEIEYISNFIELQKIRFGNTAEIKFSMKGNFTGKKIAPLILIPFVENVFKHGVNPEENSDIQISMDINGSELKLTTYNKKVKRVIDIESKSGLGIENTKQRIELMYPEKHILLIQDTAADFKLFLKLILQ